MLLLLWFTSILLIILYCVDIFLMCSDWVECSAKYFTTKK